VSALAEAPVWLIGCGNMGRAMLLRWIAAGMDPQRVTVITRGAVDLPEGVRHTNVVPEEDSPGILVLAVKPQQLDVVAPRLAHLRPALLVSILAGVEVAALAARMPADAIVRAMPNLPVAIGKGVTALFAGAIDPGARAVAEELATPLGLVEWIDDEAQFDAVTALAGCGPGFVFRFADALAKAGAALGLPADQAARLALATLEGSASMAAASDDTPATLADRVASPGGSTRKGLDVLDQGGALVALMTETLAASARRNAEMAAAAR
jgi:pyrroline-5-carboxylate reductase